MSVSAILPAAAAAATGILAGAAMVATRFVIDQSDPISLALLRYTIGSLLLLPVALTTARFRFARRDLAPIAALGIAQFAVLVVLLNLGLQYIPSGRAALIFSAFPLLTMIFAAALGREPLTTAKTIGVLLTIAGVGLALGESLGHGGGGAAWIGALAVLASAATGAACSVLYRPYLRRYPTLPVSAFAMLASVAFLAVLAATQGFFATPPRFTPAGWLAVLFIGANSAVGYYLWLWALNRATPTRVTVFVALGPVTAALLGAWLLTEVLSAMLLLGIACVALGLWLAHWRPRADGPVAAASD